MVVPRFSTFVEGTKLYHLRKKLQKRKPYALNYLSYESSIFQQFLFNHVACCSYHVSGRKAQFSVKELIECTPIITGPDTSAVDAITYTSQQGLRLVSQYADWSSDHIQGTCHRNAWKIPPSVQTAGAEFISTQYPSTLQKAICQKGPLILHIQVIKFLRRFLIIGTMFQQRLRLSAP